MENLSYRLEGIVKSRDEPQDFEGPLNLILTLLSKNKIEIRDIQISLILDQYLAHIAEMQSIDLELASEFVQMASHLVYIKTKMLLSGDKELTELELLISSLEQIKNKDTYSSIKAIVPRLDKAQERGLALITKPPERLSPSPVNLTLSPEELYSAIAALSKRLTEVIEKPPLPEKIIPGRITYGVREKSLQLLTFLRNNGKARLAELFAMSSSISELVATFISILELCSLGSICLLRDGDDVTVTYSGGNPDEIIDSIREAGDTDE